MAVRPATLTPDPSPRRGEGRTCVYASVAARRISHIAASPMRVKAM